MNELHTALLREKFTIKDNRVSLVVMSNRMEIQLLKNGKATAERYIVRGQNMHGTIRMAARIVQELERNDPADERLQPLDWEKLWKPIANSYEQNTNPDLWIAVYCKNRLIFSDGNHHPFLDVIEKYAPEGQAYEQSIALAEQAFQDTGKPVTILQDGNVALNVDLKADKSRCGIILRTPIKTTIFTFSTSAKAGDEINLAQCLGTSAAFLEGIQLCFTVGSNNEKIHIGLIDPKSDEGKLAKETRQRINRLRSEINNFEETYRVSYRPEKPDFNALITEAEEHARQTLEPPAPKSA